MISAVTASCAAAISSACRQGGGVLGVGGQVLQVARPVRRRRGDPGDLGFGGDSIAVLVGDREHEALEPRRLGLLGGARAIAVEAVPGEDRAGDQRRGQLGGVAAGGDLPGERAGVELGGALRDDRRSHPEALGVELLGGAEADGEVARPRLGVDDRKPFEDRLGVGRSGRLADLGGQLDPVGEAHGD